MLRFALLAAFASVCATAGAQGVLLVPDFTGDRVLAFSPLDGSLINANFIVDVANLESPKSAFDSGRGTVLVADQISDAVFEYSYGGAYLGKVAGGGVGPILDNIRGAAVKDGSLYITNFGSTGGAPGRAVVKVDLSNSANFSNLITGTFDPFDVLCRENDLLVSDSTGDDILRFDYSGVSLGVFHESNGSTGVNWPQQMSFDTDGNILVGNFSPTIGVYKYDAVTGSQLNFWATPMSTGSRGARRLLNGNILFTWGTGVGVFNPITNSSSLVIGSVNAQYINYSYGFDVPVMSYTISQGSEFAGGLASMVSSDDICLAVFNDENTLAAQVELNGVTSVLVPTSYRFKFEAFVARPGLSQLLEMKRTATSGWTVVDGRVAPLTDQVVEVTLTSTAVNHVSSTGQVGARVTWMPINDEDPATDGWIHCIDQAFWTIQ